MAQIYVFGHVENDLVPQTSQKGSTYVCFYLKERTGKGRFQSYQVWAWEEDVFRLLNGKVHKGSFIWLTGTQELADCTADQGKTKTKRLKVYLDNWGFVPGRDSQPAPVEPSNEPNASITVPAADELDGNREALPE